MQDKETAPLLIQTKLNRPPLPVNMVHRPRLTKWLKRHQRQPLTLISAPAGYGKSTLISCWLEAVDRPAAWVSLDEHDNEFGSFLAYFMAAIQTIYPDAAPETQTFLTVTPKPPVAAIAHTLINELDQIEAPFILVLDDYHLIENGEIHDLISELLLHPPRNFHLVLGTRMDPPLPLVTLRASGMMTEVRIADLRFNREESQSLIEQMLESPVDRAVLIELQEQSEGWVTGLRLATLAMRHRVQRDASQLKLSPSNRYVSEYLFDEILDRQAATISNCLLKTSILERFCADLCERICFSEEKRAGHGYVQSGFSGAIFLEWLEASNLFVIPLDDQHEYYRYHHLFQDFLQQQLKHRFSPEEVAMLHAVAGRWFADNGAIEEALYHLLAARDHAAAIQLVAEQRYNLLNTIQWPRLERWLSLFPSQIVESSAELWMQKTELVYQRGQWAELPCHLQHMADLLEQVSDQATADRLAGEACGLRSLVAMLQTDMAGAISLARQALEVVPPAFWIMRVLARIILAMSLLMSGDEKGGFQTLYSAFEEEKVYDKRFKGTLLQGTCYLYWFTADLQGMAQAAKQAIALCQEASQHQILRISNYHLGCVRYQQNDLSAAADLFSSLTAHPYQNYGSEYTSSVCGLGLTYQAQGKDAEARQLIEGAVAFLLETGNMTQLPMVWALQAEIELRHGHLGAASQWADKIDPVPPFTPIWEFLAPHLTLVKVWLAQNTPASYEKAGQLLARLNDYLAETHNTRFLIDTLALQALLADVNGDQAAALYLLESSLKLAQPSGFIRVFLDLGQQVAALLSRMKPDPRLSAYKAQILAAFPAQQSQNEAQITNKPSAIDNLVEPLTNRELQVLKLLREHLTNKEIAAQLVISPGTVKGHTIRIYQKLNVKGRYQAVEKAITLGILASR